MKRLGILLLVFSMLAACGARNQVPITPMASESSSNRPSSFLTVGSTVTVPGEKEQIVVATPPPPYDPKVDGPAVLSAISHAIPLNAPSVHSNAVAAVQTLSVRRPLAYVSSYDQGGQAGVVTNPGSATGNGGVYVAMTAYDDATMNAPPDNTHQNVLYAPTTHGPNGNCFELGSDYWSTYGVSGTSRYVRLYDFCDNGGRFEDNYDKIIDSNFINAYVRVFSNGNGYPEYTTEQLLESDGKWHATIYNYSTSQWEDWGYSSAGTSNVNGNEGWSIFETHYAVGECSALPIMSTDGLRVLTSSGWQLVDSSMGSNNQDYLQCFAAVPTYYVPDTTATFYQWTVASATPTPAPTPSTTPRPRPSPTCRIPCL